MPWIPELFSAPALQQLQEKYEGDLPSVPFFDGLLTGEMDALIGSFAKQPELHHPVRGRVSGVKAFEKYVADTRAWLTERNGSIEYVLRVSQRRHGLGEVVLHLDGDVGRVELPVAVVAVKQSDGHIVELRIYYSSWCLTGRHAIRPPLLQADPKLRESDVVGEHQAALSAGDVDAIVATFQSDGYAREPAGRPYVHHGRDALREFYELLFSNDGGIALEHCAVIDNGKACALEYNLVRWGKTKLPPQAGIAVYERGESGKLAAARIYDDVSPPLGSRM